MSITVSPTLIEAPRACIITVSDDLTIYSQLIGYKYKDNVYFLDFYNYKILKIDTVYTNIILPKVLFDIIINYIKPLKSYKMPVLARCLCSIDKYIDEKKDYEWTIQKTPEYVSSYGKNLRYTGKYISKQGLKKIKEMEKVIDAIEIFYHKLIHKMSKAELYVKHYNDKNEINITLFKYNVADEEKITTAQFIKIDPYPSKYKLIRTFSQGLCYISSTTNGSRFFREWCNMNRTKIIMCPSRNNDEIMES
jgi:hypothetical protein